MDAAASTTARQNMVDSQLRTNKIVDERVIAVFETVPREAFLPPAAASLAYIDEDVAIAPGRWLIEPMVFARLVQAAQIGPDDMVLELAAGSGYGTAVLGKLAHTVVSVESEQALVDHARAALASVGVANAVVTLGAIADGFAKQAPYDVVVIQGAVQTIPPTLLRQLKPGARVVTVERGDGPGTGRAMLYRHIHGALSGSILFDAATPLLPELRKLPVFSL